LALITRKSSLEPLVEGLLAQIQIDLSGRVFGVSAGIEPETCGQPKFVLPSITVPLQYAPVGQNENS